MIITRAPLRVSFLGGGSDFPGHFREHGGAVLATAIDQYVYVTVSPFDYRFHGNRYKFAYSRTEVVDSIDDIEHPAIRESVRLVGLKPGLEMHTIADLPARTGLGSSSTFVVAMLRALYAFQGRLVSTRQLAREAIRVERDILAEAGGYQDQVLAAYGGLNLVEFSGGGDFEVVRMPVSCERLRQMEEHCILLYTGIRRNSFEALARQQQRSHTGRDDKHLCALASLARDGAQFLASPKPLREFGEILHENWTIKKKVLDASLPVIDEAYETARANGAVGGKILGAGQGGFLLLWAPPECHPAILRKVGDSMQPLTVSFNAPGATIIHT